MQPQYLNTEINLDNPDGFYHALNVMHRDLSDAQSARVNANLILLLANHIGDMKVLDEAMQAAREEATEPHVAPGD